MNYSQMNEYEQPCSDASGASFHFISAPSMTSSLVGFLLVSCFQIFGKKCNQHCSFFCQEMST